MSNDTVKAAAPELKPETAAFSEILQKGIKVDKTGATDIQPDLYVANLPEHLNEQLVKDVSAYNTKFVSGASHALGVKATEAMEKHPGIEEVTGTFAFTGHDKLEVTTLRKTTVRAPKTNEEIIKYGHTTPTLTLAAASKSSTSLKNVRAVLGAKAAEAFGS